MTTQEFSDAFDTLLNSYASQAAFGEEASKQEVVLDEYEKSVLLTQAQDLIVKSYFYGNQNPQGQGFDDSTRRQVDFSSLIKVATLTPVADSSGSTFDDRGILYSMPRKKINKPSGTLDTKLYEAIQDDNTHVYVKNSTNVLFILNEKMQVEGDNGKKKDYVVVPLNYKEYDREMSKAYAQPFKKQAWRLFQNTATGFDVQSELIPIWDIAEDAQSEPTNITYKVRYVQRPDPIVLTNLPNGLTIDGISEVTECTLNPILHIDILNRAVELAMSTRGRVASTNRNNQQ